MELSANFHRHYLQVLQARHQSWRSTNISIYSNTCFIKHDLAQLFLCTASDTSTTNHFQHLRSVCASKDMESTNANGYRVTDTSCKNKQDKSLMYGLLLRCIPTAACSSQNKTKDSIPHCVSDASSKNKQNKSLQYGFLRCLPTALCSSQKKTNDSVLHSASVEGQKGEGLPGVLRKRSLEQNRSSHISEQELSQWLEKETGMDRLRMMYSLSPDGTFVHQDTRDLNTMFYTTVGMGAGASIALAYLEQRSEKQRLISNMQPLLQGSFKKQVRWKTIMAESAKNTLRITVASALIFHLSQAIAAYRNKSSVWEYAVSSSLGIGVINLRYGLKQFAKMSVYGAVVGTIGGYIVCNILEGKGLNQEQKHLGWVRHHWQEQKYMK